MTTNKISYIAKSLNLKESQVENTLELLNEGATIPFISRYRKERTGSLDEVQIADISALNNKLIELEKRKIAVLESIKEQGKLTPELETNISRASSLTELEDIYLPFKQKRKTKADTAKENGLEPLAKIIMAQNSTDIENSAYRFLSNKIVSIEDALQGARHIIAEWISERQISRNKVRYTFSKSAILHSKLVKDKEKEGEKFADYFSFNEPLKRVASHRLLAIYKGKNEGFLKISVKPDVDEAIAKLEQVFIKANNDSAKQIKIAVKDSYKRLIEPSIEKEFLAEAKEKADIASINVFAENLRQLLTSAPLGQKRVMGIDPGYKSGCKVVCLDNQGNLLTNANIYPHKPQQETKQAARKIASLVDAYKVEAIAIGNGTASRETEYFIKKLKFSKDIRVYVVSEDGASIYSASKIAREEFPEYDVTVRGSVSIGRRLLDPLAELVKIDPKSMGVGQYQHDVDQTKLKETLDLVVESCVNMVGVNVNTASKHLLTYVSGLGPKLAQSVVDYRKENGNFNSRTDIMNVPGMGKKSYQQCAGFLRISEGKNILDNTAVHPESYKIVKQIAKDLKLEIASLISNDELISSINLEKYITKEIGLPTLTDITEELKKPGRDPRKIIKVFEFAKGVFKIEDLSIGMIIPGIINNVTNFGAFVDIGIKENGLIHISNLKNEFISNPADIVKLHQHVMVKIIDIDSARKRIQLSMKDLE